MLIRNKLKIIGGDQTENTFRLPVCPSVLIKSEKNRITPIIIPITILSIFFTLSFLIDSTHQVKPSKLKLMDKSKDNFYK